MGARRSCLFLFSLKHGCALRSFSLMLQVHLSSEWKACRVLKTHSPEAAAEVRCSGSQQYNTFPPCFPLRTHCGPYSTTLDTKGDAASTQYPQHMFYSPLWFPSALNPQQYSPFEWSFCQARVQQLSFPTQLIPSNSARTKTISLSLLSKFPFHGPNGPNQEDILQM